MTAATAELNEPQVLNPDAPEDEDVQVLVPEGALTATADEDETVIPAEPSGKKPIAPIQGLEEMRAQLDERTREAEEAKRRAREEATGRAEAERRAAEFAERGLSAEEALVETQLKTAEGDIDALKQQKIAAYESGDYKEAAELDVKVAEAVANRNSVKAQKQRIEQAKTEPAPRREQRQQDPVEATLAQVSAEAADWFRQHPGFIRPDGRIKGAIFDAHESAVDAGCKPDSPAYFAHVEQELGIGAAEPESEPEPKPQPRAQAKPQPRGAPMTAAPVTRSATPGARKTTPNTVTLKPEHRKAAEDSGITPAEYAAQSLKLMREGKLPQNFFD